MKWINHQTIYPEANINLFCFPHAGSSSTFFAPWSKYFSHQVNLFPVQYPGRDNRMQDPMPDTLLDMARQMAEESESLFEKPFVFLGHCSGSIVAFEAAQHIRTLYGKEPEILFVSASTAPKEYRLRSTKNLPDDAFFKYYDFPEEMIQKENPLFQFFLPIIRKDFALCEAYRYQEEKPLNCPIYAFCGDADKAIKNITLVDLWKNYTTSADFTKKVYEGNHFYFERNAENICHIIEEKILSFRQTEE